MHPRIAVTCAALTAILMTACSSEEDRPTPAEATSSAAPSAAPSAVVPAEPMPSPTCSWPSRGEVSATGSGFVAELNVMSGRPNPAWRLTTAEGVELRRLLRSNRAELDLDGPDELGGYGVSADGAALAFLEQLALPSRFWVQGEGEIATFLGTTLPCSPTASDRSSAQQPECEVVMFEGLTYRLTPSPEGTGPGVGRLLGEGRTGRCTEGSSSAVTVYSVNEESPEQAVTISYGDVVLLYTRPPD